MGDRTFVRNRRHLKSWLETTCQKQKKNPQSKRVLRLPLHRLMSNNQWRHPIREICRLITQTYSTYVGTMKVKSNNTAPRLFSVLRTSSVCLLCCINIHNHGTLISLVQKRRCNELYCFIIYINHQSPL